LLSESKEFISTLAQDVGRQGSCRFSPSNRKALRTLSRSSKNEAGFVFETPLHTSPATAGQKSAGALNASPARRRLVSATSPFEV